MRRWILSKKDRKRLAEALSREYPGYSLDRDARVEVAVFDDFKIYVVEGLPAFIEAGGRLIPHLLYLLRRGYQWLPYVVVDQGAVRPVSRGANLMRPGVVEFHGDYRAGQVFVVVEPSRRLPIAVQEAVVSREEAERMEKGMIGRSLHHIGDKYWKTGENL